MKKTGYEIIGMIKDGKAPKKIKYSDEEYILNDNDVIYKNNKHEINLLYLLNDEFEIIEDSKVWKPQHDERFYAIDHSGYVIEGSNTIDRITDEIFELGNCFKTIEEAQKVVEKIKIYMQLKRYAEEHNTEKIDWDNKKQGKWCIFYSFGDMKLSLISNGWEKHLSDIYFTSSDLCWEAIKEIGEDNIKKLFEE